MQPLSGDEALILDTLDLAAGLSGRSGDAAFLSGWASRMIDRGFHGPEVSTLWLDAGGRSPPELAALLRAALREAGVTVAVADRDRGLVADVLAVRRWLAAGDPDPDDLPRMGIGDPRDARLWPLHAIVCDADVAIALYPDDAARRADLVARCGAWLEAVQDDIAPSLATVARVFAGE